MDTRERIRRTYSVVMTQDQARYYLENTPPVELEDGRIITFKNWARDYIAKEVNEEIRAHGEYGEYVEEG